VRVLVDGASCMGHGRCYAIAPDLFTYDDEGYPTIRDELVEVPGALEGAADEAAGSCPEEAIALIVD
jgi:ferredoxin